MPTTPHACTTYLAPLGIHRLLVCFAEARMEEAQAAIEFSVRGVSLVSPEQLDSCARLFSAHYGVWGDGALPSHQRGSRVRLSSSRLREQCLFDDRCCLALSTLADGSVVGHAFATRFRYNNVGWFSWITQLVVGSSFRRRGVATKLCQVALGDVNAVAGCGIVTSHPHAIRALEKATRSHCEPGRADLARALLSASGIPYLQGRDIISGPHPHTDMCTVDTGFFVDHADINQHIIPSQPARLGLRHLDDGQEFVAFITLHSVLDRPAWPGGHATKHFELR